VSLRGALAPWQSPVRWPRYARHDRRIFRETHHMIFISIFIFVLIGTCGFLLRSRNKLSRHLIAVSNERTHLRENHQKLLEDHNQLMTVLQGMIEGVVLIDATGKIVLANPAFYKIFFLEERAEGKTFLECIRNKDIHDAIEKVLLGENAVEHEVLVQLHSEEKYFMIHAASYQKQKKCEGAVVVFHDVTPLRKLENMRREFVANVSHELKTPLTNIRGYAETLLQGALTEMDPVAAKRFLSKIESNALQLQELVEDILKISAIESANESGRLELNLVSVSLKKTVQEILERYEEALQEKKISVSVHIAESCFVKADYKALKQILGNLIENAIQYTPQEGMIILDAKEEGDLCKIFVTDTGIGISEQDIPHLFERFYRVDKARTRSVGGTGLGLSIVKHLVQAHGGDVGVTSELGKGSSFYFTLLSPLYISAHK